VILKRLLQVILFLDEPTSGLDTYTAYKVSKQWVVLVFAQLCDAPSVSGDVHLAQHRAQVPANSHPNHPPAFIRDLQHV
jgi:predicted ABC-type transport system involved in lysophospholipase L1 biosynthesis ATPase subunit